MQNEEDIVRFLENQPLIYSLLEVVSKLKIDNCWIGAGLIRNAIWDHLHHFPITLHASSDIDVIYFDRDNCDPKTDRQIEGRLLKMNPALPWSVRNQARMHTSNNDSEYSSINDALIHWPETATAIAARLYNNQIEILAPHGVQDLLNLKIRPSPAFSHKTEIYEKRQRSKKWRQIWPKLT
jgi:uncharacterized protein